MENYFYFEDKFLNVHSEIQNLQSSISNKIIKDKLLELRLLLESIHAEWDKLEAPEN